MTKKQNSSDQWGPGMITMKEMFDDIAAAVQKPPEPSAQIKVFCYISDFFAGAFTWVLVIPAAVIDGFRRAWSDMLTCIDG